MIVMSPKRLLRLPAAVSPLADFAPDRAFQPLVTSPAAGPIDRGSCCARGKIAYDLEAERAGAQGRRPW